MSDVTPAKTEDLSARLAELGQALARRTREMAALNEISMEINSQPNLSTLLNAIVEKAAGLCGAHMGGLYLLRPDGETLELVVAYHLPGNYQGATIRVGEGLSSKIAQSGQSMMIPDYSAWAERAAIFPSGDFQRVLGVPLKVRDKIIGVINVTHNQKPGPFDADEVRLVSLFADQAAIAIEYTRWHEAALLGQKSLALSKLPADSPARDHIEKAVKAAERATALTRQLLAYSGRGQFEKRPLDLNALIRDNQHLFEVAVPKNVQLQLDLADALPYVDGDTGQIQQVIMNLIINAGEAIGGRPGTVTVSTFQQTISAGDAACRFAGPGLTGFIQKPYDDVELTNAIQQYMQTLA